jgi:NADH dehydrogenase [ubiquinone] 1 alpha subcomplex assembly factor 7
LSELRAVLAERIRSHGPITVAEFMATALGHPVFGYYATRDPLGRAGDFVTAPEISQVFGELLGLALGQAWLDRGAPAGAVLVELGPGRGTLMLDAWRALARVPGAHEALTIHLVETSPHLEAIQRQRLASLPARWQARLEDVPPAPLLLVANEFLDALPVHQLVRREAGWCERRIGLDGEVLAFVETPAMALPQAAREMAPGVVTEVSPARTTVVAEVAARIARRGGAALFVDYGAVAAGPTGDTLQAVRGHAQCAPLDTPGEADLSTQVDFGPLVEVGRGAGAAVFGPLPQGVFLPRLGIETRIGALVRAGGPTQAPALHAALHRLIHPEAMGELFKVLALADPGGPPPPGFGPEDRTA